MTFSKVIQLKKESMEATKAQVQNQTQGKYGKPLYQSNPESEDEFLDMFYPNREQDKL